MSSSFIIIVVLVLVYWFVFRKKDNANDQGSHVEAPSAPQVEQATVEPEPAAESATEENVVEEAEAAAVVEAAPAATENAAEESSSAEVNDLDAMSKADLLALAEARGVYVAKSWTKGKIIEALQQ